MKKALPLLGLGVVPLIPGLLLMWAIPTLPSAVVSLLPVLSVLFLLVWGLAAYKLCDPSGGILRQALPLCAFGLLMLLLTLIQELAVGHYWEGPLGLLPQAFFLPWYALASAAASLLSAAVTGPLPVSTWGCSAAILLALFAAACAGFLARRRG